MKTRLFYALMILAALAFSPSTSIAESVVPPSDPPPAAAPATSLPVPVRGASLANVPVLGSARPPMVDPLHLQGTTNCNDWQAIAAVMTKDGFPVDAFYLATQAIQANQANIGWDEGGYGLDLSQARPLFQKYGYTVVFAGQLTPDTAGQYLKSGCSVIMEGSPLRKQRFGRVAGKLVTMNHTGLVLMSVGSSILAMDPAANNGAGGMVSFTPKEFASVVSMAQVQNYGVVVRSPSR